MLIPVIITPPLYIHTFLYVVFVGCFTSIESSSTLSGRLCNLSSNCTISKDAFQAGRICGVNPTLSVVKVVRTVLYK